MQPFDDEEAREMRIKSSPIKPMSPGMDSDFMRHEIEGCQSLEQAMSRTAQTLAQQAPAGLTARADEIQIAAAEVVANAYQHAPAPQSVSVVVETSATCMRLIVIEDTGPNTIDTNMPDVDAESGRGLAIVNALTDVFEHHHVDGRSKLILTWAEQPQ